MKEKDRVPERRKRNGQQYVGQACVLLQCVGLCGCINVTTAGLSMASAQAVFVFSHNFLPNFEGALPTLLVSHGLFLRLLGHCLVARTLLGVG